MGFASLAFGSAILSLVSLLQRPNMVVWYRSLPRRWSYKFAAIWRTPIYWAARFLGLPILPV
jgi:hypothetical protein